MKRPSMWRYYAKYILTCGLVVAIGAAFLWLLFGVGSLFGPDASDWKPERLDWNYGAITIDSEKNTAKYSATFDSLYTPDLIACTGYEITVSFPAGTTLTVYYFDAEDNFLGEKTITDDRFVHLESEKDGLPEGLAGIRLCLKPDNGTTFKFPGLNIGNVFVKHKYSSYVGLEITNKPADVSADDITGV